MAPQKDDGEISPSRSAFTVGPDDSLSTPSIPGSAQGTLNLRPLSIGEVLDRAFHLYFKHVALFTAIVGIVIVPSVIFSYFSTRDLIGAYIGLFQQMRDSPHSTPDLAKLSSYQPSDVAIAFQYALLFVGFPFAYGAVIAAVSKAYLGLPISFKDSYAHALRRWLWIVILIVLWAIALFVMALVIIFGLAIIAAIIIPSAVALSKYSAVFAIFFAVIIVAVALAAITLFIMLYLTGAVSFISVVIEDVDPIAAFGRAFPRIFSRTQFWRGFVLALALMGINIGVTTVLGLTGAILAFELKSPALYLTFASLASLFFGPFAAVAAAVFYYDIRIRREGYDLQMLVDRFAHPAPTTPGTT